MKLLHKLWTREFTLPQFEPARLEFDSEADSATERHSAPPLDPAEELRNALAELRRSLA